MSIFFADSSAIIKRYVAETGSLWVRSWAMPDAGNTIIISRLTTVEVIAGLARRQRETTISTTDFTTLRGAFIRHSDTFYIVIGLQKRTFIVARDLVVKHALRTLDALQLACALEARKSLGSSIMLITADHRLLTAATAEGFAVDDPNQHP